MNYNREDPKKTFAKGLLDSSKQKSLDSNLKNTVSRFKDLNFSDFQRVDPKAMGSKRDVMAKNNDHQENHNILGQISENIVCMLPEDSKSFDESSFESSDEDLNNV